MESQSGKRSSITPEGYKRLQAELNKLWSQDRPKATRDVQEAAAHGDRSENAEYLYGKKLLREIDRKIRDLSKRLESVRVIDSRGRVSDRVQFGAYVTLEAEDGSSSRYQVVGPDESDPAQGRISTESPLGSSLLGKREGDEVLVQRPAGEAAFVILAIEY
jgi:transcription elongation factor GreB